MSYPNQDIKNGTNAEDELETRKKLNSDIIQDSHRNQITQNSNKFSANSTIFEYELDSYSDTDSTNQIKSNMTLPI